MTTLLSYEPLVSSTTAFFLDQTSKRYAQTGKPVNFAEWLQYYAFDVIGELAWSKRLGFVERDEDVDGIISQVDWQFDYGTVVSLILIHPLLIHMYLGLKLPTRLARHPGRISCYCAILRSCSYNGSASGIQGVRLPPLPFGDRLRESQRRTEQRKRYQISTKSAESIS